jgi:alpha-mannosidase
VGELYLEYHRGTLTSVAKNKRNNRLAEQTLHELELLGVMAARRGMAYPREALASLWESVLLNQFHDILPGTSIGFVYEDSDRDYAAFFAAANALRARLGGALAPAGRQVVVNAASHRRDELLHLPADVAAIELDGRAQATQAIMRADGLPGSIIGFGPIAGLQARIVDVIPSAPALPPSALSATPTLLENEVLRARFNARGQLTSLFDKRANRDAIIPGAYGNAFVAHQDIPIDFDAWDIDDYVEDKSWAVDQLVGVEVTESGPYRAAIRFQWRYENSRIVQIVSLAQGAAQLEFDSFVDWREHQALLKVGFPLNLRTDTSRAETQFGHLTRPTHANTSWDKARFETSMHRWVDLSEAEFGVAALNDCKYGYDAKGSMLRLTLIKSPVFPWPEADQGEHRFRYALLLHDGNLQAVHNAAVAFNAPLQLIAGNSADARLPHDVLASLDSDQVAIETVKATETGDGMVLRLWETQGKRGLVTLTLSEARRVCDADLLETEGTILAEAASAVRLAFGPFQIRTLVIR